jgi:polysaccharide export outer membrane protein
MKPRFWTSVFVGFLAVGLSVSAAGQAGQPNRTTGNPAPPAPARPTAPVPVDDEFRIGPEDVLNVVVLGQPDYSRQVPVRPDGKISLPAVNDVQAAGLTPMELRAALTKKLEAFINQSVLEVSVIVTEVNSLRVSVIGQVRTPTRFILRSRATVLDALAMAGGFTDFAKRERIVLKRLNGMSYTFNYDQLIERPDSVENMLVRGGDIIIVP